VDVTEPAGEFELIARLATIFGTPSDGLGIGDDAATWPAAGDTVAVATTDMLVEGIHFRLDWTSAADLGWKALAVNLSDLAAMGARPGRALVSVAVDATRRGLVVEVARGLKSLADRTGTQVVGGDTVRSPGPLVINVALVGEADHARLLRRDAARVGDLVGVTGTLGAASAGLALLTERGPHLEAALDPLVAALHRPVPRLAAGAILARLGVRCAIDISDGLASETGHLARASGVGVEIDVDRLPLAPGAVQALGSQRAIAGALSGGEDYELLFTFDPGLLDALAAALGIDGGMTVVGTVTGRMKAGTARFVQAGREIDLRETGYVAF
jgi:thiamine-monophosphate kinase